MDCDLYYRSRNTSPKIKVLLLSGIMAVFGVSVSIVIIAAGGGFLGFASSLFSPPNTSNLWTVGENINAGNILNYSLTRIGSHNSPWSGLGEDSSLVDSSVSIQFTEDSNNNNNWQTIIGVINGTAPSIAKNKQATISLSKQQLTNAGPIDQAFKPYYEPIESSIIEVRDIAEGPKYLVSGAEWNSITGGITTLPVKVTVQEKIRTTAGTFDTYVLSYTIGPKTSRIWIAQDFPLPIKAEVYNAYDQLQYKYDLVSYKIA